MVAKLDNRIPLTPVQQRVLEFIRAYADKHKGITPTFQEIADSALSGASKTTAHEHVHALATKGWIQLRPHVARTIRLIDPPDVCPYCQQRTKRNIFGADDLRRQLAETREKIDKTVLVIRGVQKYGPGPVPDLAALRELEEELICRIQLATFEGSPNDAR